MSQPTIKARSPKPPITDSPRGPAFEGLTVCRLCNAVIGPGVPIIGASPTERIQQFVIALYRHLAEQHRKESDRKEQTAMYLAAAIRDLVTLQHYTTDDSVLAAAIDAARAPVHAMTRKYALTDEQLQALIAEAIPASPFSKAIEDAAMPIARKIRDLLSEQGEFEHPAVKAARETSQGSVITS